MNQNQFVGRWAAVAATVAALVSGLADGAIFPQKANAWTCEELLNTAFNLREKAFSQFLNGYFLLGNSMMQQASTIDNLYRQNCSYEPPLVQTTSPPPFDNLVSDSGRLKVQRNGYNLSYFYSEGGKQIQGYVNVFSVSGSKVRGTFKDSNGFGCKGEVVFDQVRQNRWISTWDLQPFKKGDKCDGATTKTMLSES